MFTYERDHRAASTVYPRPTDSCRLTVRLKQNLDRQADPGELNPDVKYDEKRTLQRHGHAVRRSPSCENVVRIITSTTFNRCSRVDRDMNCLPALADSLTLTLLTESYSRTSATNVY